MSIAPSLQLVVVLTALAACGERSYAEIVVRDGPASYWRFGETEPAQGAADVTGRAPAVVTRGVAPSAPGAIARDADGAFTFDGVGGAVVAPDVYAFDGTHPFTVEVWIAPVSGGAPIQRICNHRQGPVHAGWRLVLDARGASARVGLERWSGDELLGAVAAELERGVYAHVVGRYDGHELALFVDGDLRRSVPDARPIAAFTAPLVWGAASTQDQDFFVGRLDEGAIYDFALGDDRIAAHHAAGGYRR